MADNFTYMLVSRLRWLAIAIFVAGVFVLFSSVSALAASAPLPCSDSDKGLDYYVKGVADGTLESGVMDGQFADYCADTDGEKSYKSSGAYVMESYCNTSLSKTETYVSMKWFKCPYGCQNGICVAASKICKETDNGNDKMVKGKNTIYNSDNTVYTTGSDYCYDKTTVAEFTCNNGQWDITYEDCGDGYACDLGACKALVAPKPSCKDTDGGNEIFTKGTLYVYTPDYGNQTVIEACADSKTMDELVCLTGDSTYAYTHKKAECPYGCKDGACIATAPVVNTKADLGLYGFLDIGQNKKEVKWNETIILTPADAMSLSGDQAAFNLYYADKNYGNAKSGIYRNAISFDGTLVSQQTNRQLDMGEKQDIWTQAYFTARNGTHKLSFKVDADNNVVESSETNNDFVVYVKLEGFGEQTTPITPAPTPTPTPTPTTPIVTYDTNAKPTILAPFNNMTLTNYPRKAEVQWTPVTSASKYELEVACDVCGSTNWGSVNNWTTNAVYMITPALAGDNWFRAKVRALYPDGTHSLWSDFVYFKYNTSQYVAPAQPTTGGGQVVPATPVVVKPVTPVKKPVGRMLCGNSAGGDGLYSACVNNTIKHDSKMNIKVRTYNNYYVWLTLTNADKKYYRVPIKKSLEIDRDDGEMTIKITYVKKNAKYGVFLQVETTFDATQINPEEDVIEDADVAQTQTSPVLPAYDETKPNVTFGVSVNDYPDHKDYTKSKNLANAYVNVYTVSLADNGTFKVLSYITENTGAAGVANVTVKSGQMVYFEGYKTEGAAKVGAVKMASQLWTTPPYKNFSSAKDKLCQTNYSKTDEFLGGTQDYACASSLSTPYQD